MASAGRLYVVATPIGNLGDLSLRAAEVLRTADLIAAEDTRVTRKLLAHVGASTRMLSYRDQNEARLAPKLVDELHAGKTVALVSDAGTPGVCDPGYRLVQAAAEAGIEVVAVPGPSAVIALLSIGGLPTDRFAFEGFAPARAAARRKALSSLAGSGRTHVFYESPARVVAFLRDIAETLDDAAVAVGRELTKLHEEVLRGRASEVAERIERKGGRGEFVVAVYVAAAAEPALEGDRLVAEVERLLGEGLSVRDAAVRLKDQGVPRRVVYEAARAVRSR